MGHNDCTYPYADETFKNKFNKHFSSFERCLILKTTCFLKNKVCNNGLLFESKAMCE